MRVKAQIMMVMNLDKCIGCNTCTIACKNVWTNRPGAEYMWWNNVETKPGVGYPKRWEDQSKYGGGWELGKNGKPKLKWGGKAKRLSTIFYNPKLPVIDDYYEPWTYDYEKLITSEPSDDQPVAKPKSLLSGKPIEIKWGPNWEDDLAGGPEQAGQDPNLDRLRKEDGEKAIRLEYERAFIVYLPRICNHCLNPSCVAACPSGAMYKRGEDGIVLVDQTKCRGWRFCVSSCPYKKVFYNWKTDKAEKCIFCYPRIESGLPPACAEQCVGKVRYVGVMLYDADRIMEAASVEAKGDLVSSELSLFLNPDDPAVVEKAGKDGVPDEWIQAARRSPVYKILVEWRVALPLHPEYRVLPMLWYVPPLSPIVKSFETTGSGSQSREEEILPAIDNMRIVTDYLAQLFSAGDVEVVKRILRKLVAMRIFMRRELVHGKQADLKALLEEVGLDETSIREMYRLLALSKYEDRFVIPVSESKEKAEELFDESGLYGSIFPSHKDTSLIEDQLSE